MSSEAELEEEIANLKARVESLKGQIQVQLNGLLTTESAREAIESDESAKALKDRLEKQQAYKQQCTYRVCAGITTFRVRDPDPNAVDNGTVLGIRIEVMTRSKFIRPYFVFLNHPYSGSEHKERLWRVHRHTVPSCVPLNGLASRYLPAPRSGANSVADIEGARVEKRQNLSRFVRTLRRELVRYHNRLAVMADMRKTLGLDGKRKDAKELAERCPIFAISAADNEAKQIRIDWKDGRSGRLVLNDDGEVTKAVVFGDRGRDREVTRELLSSGGRLEDVAQRLAAV
ncbi:hypothetical protein N0V93_009329 [Gnomoniopsis smithogilvyi]|uniref:Cenp-O kinetochore centromere component n=1 Tax=Gnomoniopsis smithogilvyi TaxID=1191159 RepID=A0A9W8YLT9_9PEZI|nr:hypothetical protein N0V93_009329 [Gnomoniopsis smithogilvyi]